MNAKQKPRKAREAKARLAGQTTKGKPHRLLKATHTARRYELRETLWKAVSKAAREHIKKSGPGEARRMSQALGVSDSQIHRFTCGTCEHDQEPTFSIGFGILLYLGAASAFPVINLKDSEIDVLALMRVRINKRKGTHETY